MDRNSPHAEERSRNGPPHSGNRTAAAGREFLRALGSDLGALAALLRPFLIVTLPASTGGIRAGWRLVRGLVLGIVLACIGGALAVAAAMLWALHGLPLDGPVNKTPQPTLLLEAADGTPLGRVGPLKFADAPLSAFPPILVKAVLSTEDRRFYRHFGIDPRGILRAARANHGAGEIVEGGSTITQQLVRIEYLNGDERTYTRKLREAMLAIWLELHVSKNTILTRYLNRVYLGDGAYGMTAAARLYFDKPLAELTLPEAAMLAGLIQAPSALDPLHHLDAARTRAATVLDAMVANHVIDAKTAAAAKAQPANVKATLPMAQASSWFTDWVGKRAASLAGAPSGSVRVRTTLVPRLQALAQQIVDDTLARQGRQLHASEAALVAMRPDGAVLAMVGGRNYGGSQFNRAVDARRPPGSAFKLFVYLAALRAGYTPQDMIDAGPIDIDGWTPENFDNEQYGRISLADAFAKSVNTASARLAMNVGLNNVIAAARDLGLDTPLAPVPSIALGSTGVSLLELTGAFASVRADRLHMRPWGVSAIGPADGVRTWDARLPFESAKTLDPYQKPLVELLQDVIKYGTGRGAALNGFAAGKTGTSQDYRDAWFVGFNDQLVVGVWVGNDDDSPMKRVVGGTLPASIWKQFMIEAVPLLGEEGMQIATGPIQNPSGVPGLSDQQNNLLQASGVAPRWCNVSACAGRYESFRTVDCTYQPYGGGPRQVCQMAQSQPEEAQSQPAGEAQSQSAAIASPRPAEEAQTQRATSNSGAAAIVAVPAECDIATCTRMYSSFRESDCSYQPFGGGPRQRCDRQDASARDDRQTQQAQIPDQ